MQDNQIPTDFMSESFLLKKFKEYEMDSCPNCGYCKHCGRGGYHSQPHYVQPHPFYPHQPQWVSPWKEHWGWNQPGTVTGIGINPLTAQTPTITGLSSYKSQ